MFNNGQLWFCTSENISFSGEISGSGCLYQFGSGELTLSGQNTYTGTTKIYSGTIIVSNIVVSDGASNLGNATSPVGLGWGWGGSGGVLRYTGNETLPYIRGFSVWNTVGEIDCVNSGSTLTIAGDAISGYSALTIGGDGNTTISSAISLDAGLVKTGSGTLTLNNGSNSYTGGTTIAQGTLSVENDGNLGGSTRPITFSGGTLQVTGTTLTNLDTHAVNWATFNGGLDIANAANTFTISQAIVGSGSLTKTGSGTLILSGATSGYTGGTVLGNGKLKVGSTSALGATTGDLTVTGGELDLNGNSITVSSLSGTGGTITDNSSGSPSILRVSISSGTSTYWGAILDGDNRCVNLVKEGAGTLELSGNNSFHDTTVTDGTLILSGSNLYRSEYAGDTAVNGGTLQGTTNSLKGDITIASTATLIFDQNFAGTFDGTISGTGGLTKTGGGTLTLAGAGACTGATTVNNGTLKLGGNGALGIVGLNVGTCGIVDLNGHDLTLSLLNGDAGAKIIDTDDTTSGESLLKVNITAGSSTYEGAIASRGTRHVKLVKQGLGTLALGGDNDLPDTTIEDGTLDLNGILTWTAGATFSSTIGTTVKVNGTLKITNTLDLGISPGTWNLNGGTIVGGTIVGKEFVDVYSNHIRPYINCASAGGTLDHVTLNVDMCGNNAGVNSLSIQNGLTLNGTLRFPSATWNNYSHIDFEGTQTLDGTGDIDLVLANTIWVTSLGTPATLTIESGITIHGSGTVEGYYKDERLINKGTLQADAQSRYDTKLGWMSGSPLTINIPSFTNYGTLLAVGAGVLEMGVDLGSGPVLQGTRYFVSGTELSIAWRGIGAKPDTTSTYTLEKSTNGGETYSTISTTTTPGGVSCMVTDLDVGSSCNLRVVAAHSDGSREIYDTGNIGHTGGAEGTRAMLVSTSLEADSAQWYRVNSVTLAGASPVTVLQPTRVYQDVAAAVTVPGNQVSWSYSAAAYNRTSKALTNVLTDFALNNRGILANSPQAAVVQAFQGLVTDGSVPPVSSSSSAITVYAVYATWDHASGVPREVQRNATTEQEGSSWIMGPLVWYSAHDTNAGTHVASTLDADGGGTLVAWTFDPDGFVSTTPSVVYNKIPYTINLGLDPTTCPRCTDSGGAGVSESNPPSTRTGAGEIAGNAIDSTGGCAACGTATPSGPAARTGMTGGGLTYDSREFMYDSGFGNGWTDSDERPELLLSGNTVTVRFGAERAIWFDAQLDDKDNIIGYSPRYGVQSTLAHDSLVCLFTLTQADGTYYQFHDYALGQTAYPQGSLLQSVAPSGATIVVTGWTDGKMSTIEYKTTPIGTSYQKREFEYWGSGDGIGHIRSVTLFENDNPANATWTEVRRISYNYYGDSDLYGLSGDLKTIITQEWDPSAGAAGDWIGNDTAYYRYYTGATTAHELKRVLLANAYAGFVSTYGDPDDPSNIHAGDGQTDPIANYTCFYYEYDADRRVTKEVVFGKSNQSEFASSQSYNDYGFNIWDRKTVETRPDGSTNTVYTNYIGQTILTDLCNPSGNHTLTFNRYDDDGKLVLTAEPSAFVTITGDYPYYDESLPDLIDYSGASPYLSATEGLFQETVYYTTEGIGHAVGYVYQTAVAKGSTGVPVVQTSYEYASRIVGGVTIHPIAAQTTYPDGNPAHGVTTTYSYTWYDSTTNGTVLVNDISVGSGNSSSPEKLVNVNGTLYFTANDGTNGCELWKSDGTSSGTAMVKDISVGSGNSSSPENLVNVNGTLFFTANDGTNGCELWKSDGTSSGTTLVKDISVGSGNSSSPENLVNVNGTLYFTANDGSSGWHLWKSDGTTSGTVLVKDAGAAPSGSSPQYLTNVNGMLYFTANNGTNGCELWKSDGTSNGTAMVKDLSAVSSDSSSPENLVNVNGTLFFTANTGLYGRELWKSDGTTSGTAMVQNIDGSTSGSVPLNLTNVNGTLFFTANDGRSGRELWKSDGTSSGTTLVKDISVGSGNSSSPQYLTNVNGTLYFTANDGSSGWHLWKSDGTTSGTVLVKDAGAAPSGSSPQYLTNVNGMLFFTANDGTSGRELWKSDGTSSGTVLVKNINGTSDSSSPENLVNVNGTLFFSANDGTSGCELWKSHDSFQIQESTTTLPAVATAENGSNATTVTRQYFDSIGNLTWTKNELGRVTYYGYDALTGRMTQMIEDVDSDLSASLNPPSGYEGKSDGLHQTTDYEYDALGRVTQTLGPAHTADVNGTPTSVRTATWTVYKDADHETWSAQGYETLDALGQHVGWTLANPVSVTKADRDGRVTNKVQVTSTDTTTVLDGTETFSRADYTAWTSYQYANTRLVSTRVYHTIPTAIGPLNNDDAIYTGTGWTSVSGSTSSYEDDYSYHDAGTGSNTVTWTFTVDPTKQYQVLVSWSADPSNASNAPFTVLNDSTVLGSVRLDQRAMPDDTNVLGLGCRWKSLGIYQASAGTTTIVAQLSDLADGRVVADAVYLLEVPSAAANYDQTTIGYENYGASQKGRQNKTVAADGTITRVVLDARGNVLETWTGTIDTGATDADPTGSHTTGNNMVKISSATYDVDGNLIESRAYYGSGANSYYATCYQYDWRDRLIGTLGPDSVARIVTLDNLGRATESQTFAAATMNGSGEIVVQSNKLRADSLSFFDALGRVYQSRQYSVDPTDGSSGTCYLPTDTWYDAAGNVIKTATGQIISEETGDVTGYWLLQKYAYDGLGRLVASYTCYDTDETAYADAGNVVGDTVVEQKQIWYDQAGQPVATATYQRLPGDTSTVGALTAANSYATASVAWYDGLGRITATADYGHEQSSDATHYFFNAGHGMIDTSPADGIPDVAQSAPPVPYTAANPTSMAGIDFQLQLTRYDSAGRAYRTIDNLGRINETRYDAAGRTIRTIQNYVNGTVEETDTEQDITVDYQYDSRGRLATMTAYNAKGDDGNPNNENVEPQSTKYLYACEYNASWQTAVVYPDSTDVLSQDSTTKIWTITTNNGDHTSSEYDRLGRLIVAQDQRGVNHEYAYDTAGRSWLDTVDLAELHAGEDVDATVRRIATAYDDVGRVRTVTSYSDASGTTAVNQVLYVYNGWGKVCREYEEHDSAVVMGLPPTGSPSVYYEYDDGAVGGVAKYVRLADVLYPNGREVDYGYGTAGAIDDIMSRLATIDDNSTGPDDALVRYGYLGAGKIVEEDYESADVELTYLDGSGNVTGLDRFGRVVDQIWTDYGADPDVVIDRYTYTYDRAGNRLTRANALQTALSETYSYNALNELISTARNDNFDQSWTLDGLGNWSGFNDDGTSQTRTTNAANEIASTSGLATPTYDAAGNMTTVPDPSDTSSVLHCRYDAWNRLVKVTKTVEGLEQTVAEYGYDGENRRIVKKTYAEGVLTEVRHYYLSVQNQVLEERLASPIPNPQTLIPVCQYVWGPRYVDDLVLRDRDTNADGTLDERLYAIQDANWNVTTVVAANGDVQERYSYTAYGKCEIRMPDFSLDGDQVSACAWTSLYTSRELDVETGLYYYRARYYDADMGTFIGRDPIGYSAGDENLYQYVGGRPTVFVDPTGERWVITITGDVIWVPDKQPPIWSPDPPGSRYWPPTTPVIPGHWSPGTRCPGDDAYDDLLRLHRAALKWNETSPKFFTLGSRVAICPLGPVIWVVPPFCKNDGSLNDCYGQAEALRCFLERMGSDYWDFYICWGRESYWGKLGTNYVNPWSKENAVWLMPKGKNPLCGYVFDPARACSLEDPYFPIQTKRQFDEKFPYDENGYNKCEKH